MQKRNKCRDFIQVNTEHDLIILVCYSSYLCGYRAELVPKFSLAEKTSTNWIFTYKEIK